jgi:hypothetical protein
MIWLTWRQFRGSAVAVATLLVVLAATLAVTGPGLAADYTAGITACVQDDTCGRFFDRFFGEYDRLFSAVTLVVLLLPALIGLFWGAPLITRELEANTHLLVWNQSITRVRWLAVKLGLVGLTAMAAAGLCGLAVTWWSDPLDKSAAPDLAMMTPLVFGARGIAPLGYAAFAFVLGVAVGMLVRRALPAMALTLAVFVAVQIAMPMLVRPHLITPITSALELSEESVDGIGISRGDAAPGEGGSLHLMLASAVPGQGGAWVLSSDLIDPSGRVINGERAGIQGVSTTSGPCAPAAGPPNMQGCLVEINRLGYRQKAVYQPLERFWPLQWIETGIYALLTIGLTGFCFWWIRRRLS